MRPSTHFVKYPTKYGARSVMNFPSTSARSASFMFPVAIGTFLPSPNVSN